MFVREQDLRFAATHVLSGLPRWHPCARMHGHDYSVKVRLETAGPLGETGHVGGQSLTAFEQWVEETLNHTHINELLPDPEHADRKSIAAWILEAWAERLPELESVEVFETTNDRKHPGACAVHHEPPKGV